MFEGGAGWIVRSSTGASKLGANLPYVIQAARSGTITNTIFLIVFLLGSSTSALIGAAISFALSSVAVVTSNVATITKNIYMVRRLDGIG